MNVSLILMTPVCLAIAIYLSITRESTADILYRYYNSKVDPKWRPDWLPWYLRPTRRQASVMTALGITFSLLLGFVCLYLGIFGA